MKKIQTKRLILIKSLENGAKQRDMSLHAVAFGMWCGYRIVSELAILQSTGWHHLQAVSPFQILSTGLSEAI